MQPLHCGCTEDLFRLHARTLAPVPQTLLLLLLLDQSILLILAGAWLLHLALHLGLL